MLRLAIVLLAAAKAPVPPPVHCEDNRLVVQPVYGDIVVSDRDVTLRDPKPVPKAKPVELPRDKTLELRGDGYVFAVKPEGWSLTKGEATMALQMPKSAKGAELRSIGGVPGKFVWISGQYWIARVDLQTGDVVSGKLARDGRIAIMLDVGETASFVNGDRLYRCGADAVCTETTRLPFTVARLSVGEKGFLFASDATTDKVVRVMRDKLETAIAVDTGANATFCPLANGQGAVYLPTAAWSVTRVSSESAEATVMTRDRLLARGLTSEPATGTTNALFDTALREKWPELESLGLIATNDPRPEVRATVAQAFSTVPSTRGFATLWLLGRDSDPTVRAAALDATARWCSKQRVVPCTSALKQYMADTSNEVSWLARDLLLIYDPLAALRDAPAEYKRDAVSHLAELLLKSSNPSLKEALQSLTFDQDAAVRAAAWETLGGMGL